MLFSAAVVLLCCGSLCAEVHAEEKGSEKGTDDTEAAQESETGQEPGMEALSDDTVRIVIDPGHGGENLGGEYEDYTEKEMTMAVANAMKEELEKYEGVVVYLTRTDDRDLSLEERCEYAQQVDADFLFCLHFNLSEYHTLFGAECWVSAFGENYSKGYEFASIEIEMLRELGLYSRGIKTRLNKNGTDYYGIIRHATERDIPCVLIEHCHLDQENDKPFYDHGDKLEEFGRLDATAAARYFGLRSEELGVDYRDYQRLTVEVPADVVAPDRSEPELCAIEVLEQDSRTGEVTVQLTAADQDSGMLYYAYSYDNGEHFSELQRWPDRETDTFRFTIQVPPHIVPHIVVNGYNGYDLCTASNTVSLPAMDYKTAEEIAAELAAKEALESASGKVEKTRPEEDSAPVKEDREDGKPFAHLIATGAVCALLLLGMAFSMALIWRGRRGGRKNGRTRRRRRRKRQVRKHTGRDNRSPS